MISFPYNVALADTFHPVSSLAFRIRFAFVCLSCPWYEICLGYVADFASRRDLSSETYPSGHNSRIGTGTSACVSRLGGTNPQAGTSTGFHAYVHSWGFAPQATYTRACGGGGPSAANRAVHVPRPVRP